MLKKKDEIPVMQIAVVSSLTRPQGSAGDAHEGMSTFAAMAAARLKAHEDPMPKSSTWITQHQTDYCLSSSKRSEPSDKDKQAHKNETPMSQ